MTSGPRPLRPTALARSLRRLVGPPSRPGRFPLASPTWPGTLPRPAPERELGIDYRSDWARGYAVRLARAILVDNVTRPLTHALAAPRVRGDDLLDLLEPPVIFVANHTSHVDTALLLSVLPPRLRHRAVVAAAADHFFDRRWKAHLWAFALNAVPIERHRVNRRSAEQAAQLVDDGWNLVVYPEGGRSPDGWMSPFKGGAIHLVVRTGRPVVPVHIRGTGSILPKGASLLPDPLARRRGKRGVRRGRTTVTFGTPLTIGDGEDIRSFVRRLDGAVTILADEERTDWWTARHASTRASAATSAYGPDVTPWRRAWALDPETSLEEPDNDPTRWALRRRR